MPKVIYVPLAHLGNACEGQFAMVRARWPRGIPLVKETVEAVSMLPLNLNWAADKLLLICAYEVYLHKTLTEAREHNIRESEAEATRRRADVTAIETCVLITGKVLRSKAKDALKRSEQARNDYDAARIAAYETYVISTDRSLMAYNKCAAPVLLELLLNTKNWRHPVPLPVPHSWS